VDGSTTSDLEVRVAARFRVKYLERRVE